MPEAQKTVTIVSNKRSGEQAIINESDYDPEKHTLWDDYLKTKAAKKAEAAADKAAEEKQAAPQQKPDGPPNPPFNTTAKK